MCNTKQPKGKQRFYSFQANHHVKLSAGQSETNFWWIRVCLTHVILLHQVLMAGLQVAEVTSCNVLHAREERSVLENSPWRVGGCGTVVTRWWIQSFTWKILLGFSWPKIKKLLVVVFLPLASLSVVCSSTGHRKRSVSMKGCCL